MKQKLIELVLAAFFFFSLQGCTTNPYQKALTALDQQYARGEFSQADYACLRPQVLANYNAYEQQRRQNALLALQLMSASNAYAVQPVNPPPVTYIQPPRTYAGGTNFNRTGNTIWNSNGGYTTKIGNTWWNSDGSYSNKIGNTYWHSDGTSTNKIGNTYWNSDGSYSNKIGNTIWNSDGSHITKVGSTYYLNP